MKEGKHYVNKYGGESLDLSVLPSKTRRWKGNILVPVQRDDARVAQLLELRNTRPLNHEEMMGWYDEMRYYGYTTTQAEHALDSWNNIETDERGNVIRKGRIIKPQSKWRPLVLQKAMIHTYVIGQYDREEPPSRAEIAFAVNVEFDAGMNTEKLQQDVHRQVLESLRTNKKFAHMANGRPFHSGKKPGFDWDVDEGKSERIKPKPRQTSL